MFNMTKIERIHPFVSRCDSCGKVPEHHGNMRVALEGMDVIQIKQMIPIFYLCKDCAERLHKQLGDILGYTPEKTEESSSMAYIEKIINESYLCRDCGGRLREQLGDILGHTPDNL